MTDWTRVQGAQTTTAGGGVSNSLALGSTVGVGHIVVGTFFINSGSVVTTITDDKGNKYLPVIYADDGNHYVLGFYPDPDSASHGLLNNTPQTITITTNVASSLFWCNITEFTPPTGCTAISLDGSQTVSNTSTTSTPNFQVLNSDVLLFSVSYSSGTSTTGAGWTADAGSGGQQCSEWMIQATPTSSANGLYATQTGSSWMVAFGIAPVARTHWIPIQSSWQHNNVAGTSGAASFANAVGSGNYVIGAVAGDNLAQLTSLVDDQGNNYKPNIQSPNFNGRGLFWFGPISNGPKTVTATYSASQSLVDVTITEFRPPPGSTSAAVDAYVSTQPAGTVSPESSGNITTNFNGDLLWSMGEPSAGGALPANSFSTLAGSGTTWGFAYQIQGSASASTSVSWAHTTPASMNIYLAAFDAITPAPTASRSLFLCRQQ